VDRLESIASAVTIDTKHSVASGVYTARVKYDGKWADFRVNFSK
jgi:hypothetical protein